MESIEEGSPNVTLTLDGQEYQCVFVETNDEAGNPTMCFSACGSNNETVWGVHYLLKTLQRRADGISRHSYRYSILLLFVFFSSRQSTPPRHVKSDI